MSTQPSKLAVIFAGEEITATFLDRSSTLVRVRAMPARRLGEVMQLCTAEAALIELVCLVPTAPGDDSSQTIAGWQPVPEGWADNLENASHVALLTAAQRLNFSRAAEWAERQIAAKQYQAPIVMMADEALSPLVEKMTSLILSQAARLQLLAPSTKS